jgi:hypothetical protein
MSLIAASPHHRRRLLADAAPVLMRGSAVLTAVLLEQRT